MKMLDTDYSRKHALGIPFSMTDFSKWLSSQFCREFCKYHLRILLHRGLKFISNKVIEKYTP